MCCDLPRSRCAERLTEILSVEILFIAICRICFQDIYIKYIAAL